MNLKKIISVKANDLSFVQVLNKFEEKVNCVFQYDGAIVPSSAKKYSINYNKTRADKAIKDFLNQCGLDYEIKANNLILRKFKAKSTVKKQFRLTGKITLKKSGEILEGAKVEIVGTNRSAYSNSSGYFSILLEEKANIVRFSYPTLLSLIDTFEGGRDFFTNIQLEIASHGNNIVIEGGRGLPEFSKPSVENHDPEKVRMTVQKSRWLPNLLGEPDILRAVTYYPGVVGGSEGILGMYIRGGTSDQNLVLLDDAPIFNSFHLFGIFSVFNTEVVKDAQLTKGSFDAKQGGRLSSVIDIQTKEGNNYHFKGSLNIGFLSSKIFLEGPIIKNRTTFTLAFRRSYLDFLVNPVARLVFNNDSLSNNKYYFWDGNLKITHKFSNKSRISLSTYMGTDVAGLSEKNNSQNNIFKTQEKKDQLSSWGNQAYVLRWFYQPTQSTSITFKNYLSVYNYSFTQSYRFKKDYFQLSGEDVNDYTEYRLRNGIRDFESSILIDKKIKDDIFSSGGGYIRHLFVPGNRKLVTQVDSIDNELIFNDNLINANEYFLFGEYVKQFNKNWIVKLGSRISFIRTAGDADFFLPDYRLNVKYQMDSGFWLKAAASRMWQYFHLLNNLALGLPSDLWVPSSKEFKPSSSDLYSLGFTFERKKYQISGDVFYKYFQNLLEYRDNASYLTQGINWQNSVTSGIGESYGGEVLVEKTSGKLQGWLAYSLMWNNRIFRELNNGRTFPFRYDRRHNLYIAAVYEINKNIQISGAFSFNSGFAVTLPVAKYSSPTTTDPYREIFIYGDRNNYRTRDNHRLDIAVNFSKVRKRYSRIWTIGIFNVYNRNNPFYLRLGYGPNNSRKLYQVSLLPILPNVSYKISF